VLSLAEEAGRHGAGSICFLPQGTTRGLTAEDHEFIIEIGRRSGLPVIIQGLGARSKVDVPGTGWEDAVVSLDKAQAEGAPFYSMLIARPFDRAVAFDDTNHHWRGAFGWHAMTRLPIEERRALLRDPAAREELRFGIENSNKDPAKGTTLSPPQWPVVFIDESPSMSPEEHQGRSIQVLAEERQMAPGDFALDLALADDFATRLRWRMDGPEWSEAVRKSQTDPRIIIGTSDGGAHLAKDDQADWSSYFLKKWVREDKVWTLEEGVRQLTQIPASILGFQDRGTLAVGNWADIMIFDEDEIGPMYKESVPDLPGGASRYKAYGKGVYATIVNGEPIVLNGEITGSLPGSLVAPS
jgi:N-acyl-D-aspartate/D-glutamate deacylase